MRLLRPVVFCVCLICAIGSVLIAQEFRATIKGHVADPSGGDVVGVTVDAINQGTNVTTTSVTGSDGDYTLPLLPPGTYTVTAEGVGFKKYVRANIVLNTGDVTGVDITLEVGERTESVVVTATTPLLDTETADEGLVIDEKEIVELPLNGRNPFMLSVLSPGVNYNGSLQFPRPFDNGAIAEWSINGGLSMMNEFLLDGTPNTSQAGGNNLAWVTPVDSVSEFKVQTTAYDAEYGRTAGGIVNVTTKSGTNQYHGTAYDFMRRTGLDADTPSYNDQAAEGLQVAKTVDYLQEEGFSLGGPVNIPKIYHGHDKTFFFVNYEDYYQENPQSENYSVPTLQELGEAPGETGVFDFSGLNNSATDGGNPVYLYNPYTTSFTDTAVTPGGTVTAVTPGAVVASNGTVTRSLFAIPNPFYGGTCPTTVSGVPGGTFSCETTTPTIQGIPSSIVNPIGLGIAKLYPSPNQNGTLSSIGATRYATSDYGMSPSSNPYIGNGEQHFYNFIAKLDQQFGTKDHVFLRFGTDNAQQQNISGPITGVGLNGSDNPFTRANYAIAADWTRTISPTLISDLRVSFSRYTEADVCSVDNSVTPAYVGFGSPLLDELPNPDGLGVYTITNFTGISCSNSENITNTKAIEGKFIKEHGPHSFKFGTDIRWIQENFSTQGDEPAMTFGTAWTQLSSTSALGPTNGTISGDGIADALLGLPTLAEADNIPNPSYLSRYDAFYFQDDWRVNSRLSLNLGLRYDVFPPPHERDSAMTDGWAYGQTNPVTSTVQQAIASFGIAKNPTTGAPLYTSSQIAAFDAAFPNGLPALTGGLEYVNNSGGGTYRTDWSGIQPRLGLAYEVTNKLVVRMGVAGYMVQPTNDDYVGNPAPGYSETNSYSQTNTLSSNTAVGGNIPAAGNVPYGMPCTSSTTAGCTGNLLTNPFAPLGTAGIPAPLGNALQAATSAGNAVNFFNPDFKTPWVAEYDLGFQLELPWQSRIEVSYVGNTGFKLESSAYYNLIPLGLRQSCDPNEFSLSGQPGNPSTCNQSLPNPFYYNPLTPTINSQFAGSTLGANSTTTLAQLSVPYPEFVGTTGTTTSGVESGLNLGRSWYNGLEVTYTVRAQHGLTLTVAYTYSKDVVQSAFTVGSGNNANTDAGQTYIDPQRGIYERSLAPWDLPQILKISSVYQLPFGRGKKFFGNDNRVVDGFIGGWEYNTVLQYISGLPWTLPANVDFFPRTGTPDDFNLHASYRGGGNIVQGVRPCAAAESSSGAISLEPESVSLPGCTINDGGVTTTAANAITTSTINFLSLPQSVYAPLQGADLRTGLLRTEPAFTGDMSLAKTVHIYERVSFQFRLEAFNVFNTPWMAKVQFNSTLNNSGTAPFGAISKSVSENGAADPLREVQLGFKVLF
jgi:hypothetical protein